MSGETTSTMDKITTTHIEAVKKYWEDYYYTGMHLHSKKGTTFQEAYHHFQVLTYSKISAPEFHRLSNKLIDSNSTRSKIRKYWAIRKTNKDIQAYNSNDHCTSANRSSHTSTNQHPNKTLTETHSTCTNTTPSTNNELEESNLQVTHSQSQHQLQAHRVTQALHEMIKEYWYEYYVRMLPHEHGTSFQYAYNHFMQVTDTNTKEAAFHQASHNIGIPTLQEQGSHIAYMATHIDTIQDNNNLVRNASTPNTHTHTQNNRKRTMLEDTGTSKRQKLTQHTTPPPQPTPTQAHLSQASQNTSILHTTPNSTTPRNHIQDFWHEHYLANQACDKAQLISGKAVYDLYVKSPKFQGELYHQFIKETKTNTNIPTYQDHTNNDTLYIATPNTLASIAQHRTTTQSTNPQIELHNINIEGLITGKRNKCHFLKAATTSDNKNKIITITETWAEGHYNAEFLQSFSNYNVMRSDRDIDTFKEDEDSKSSRGGVMLLTSPEITITPKISYSNGGCELLIADLPTIHTTLITIYRPPKASLRKFADVIKKAEKHLTELNEQGDIQNIIMTGDFNFRPETVRWEANEVATNPIYKLGLGQKKQALQLLMDLVDAFELHQKVDKPTTKDNTLDLIFSNKPHLMDECRITNMAGITDHHMVSTNINVQQEDLLHTPANDTQNQPEVSMYDFRGGNIELLKKKMQEYNWDGIINDSTDVGTLNTVFEEALVDIANQCGVKKFKPTRHDNTTTTHLSKPVQKLLKEKKKWSKIMEQKHHTSRNKDLLTAQDNIARINKQIEAQYDKEREEVELKVINEIKTNTKAFYTYANRNKTNKSRIGPLRSGTTFAFGEKEMADILSKQYASVFSTPKPTYNFTLRTTISKIIQDIDITTAEIQLALQDIKPSSAPGPDGIPAFVLNQFAKELSYPIMKIWRKSLDTAIMPEGVCKAIITPIFKDGDKSNPEKYRPVSLTNHLTKTFERLLRKHLISHLEINDMMNPSQHGFRGGRSTITQLLHYYDSILTLLEEGRTVDAIYLDFAKAFDKVDHHILLHKLHQVGIRGKIYAWIQAFLTNRTQQVRVGQHLSNIVRVESGIPQGSVLGPLFFIIMMFDIDKDLEGAFLGSFADDTRIWSGNNNTILQRELNKMYQWAEANNMEFNGKKFERLSYGSATNTTQYTTPLGKDIEQSNAVKDLGIYMSGTAKFEQHITNIVKEARKVSAWVLRTFKTRKTIPMLTLLKALIISKLEYASVVWSPGDQGSINTIENIQRGFTAKIAQFRRYDPVDGLMETTVDYWQRLKTLHLYSLERRRERFMILYIYKIKIGLVPNIGLVFDYNIRTGTKVTPKLNRKAPTWVTSIRQHTFFSKGPQLYNLMPKELRTNETIDTPGKIHVTRFKNKLDKWMNLIPDQPTIDEQGRAALTNSLLHQLPMHANDIRRKWIPISQAIKQQDKH